MEPIIFSRYLYLCSDAAVSLKWAVFSDKRNEALFWAYELFWSGFEKETIGFLLDLAKTKYNDSPKLLDYLETLALEYNGENYEILASIVSNMTIDRQQKKQFYVRCNRKTAEEYLTIKKQSFRDLERVSKYGVNLEKIVEENLSKNIDAAYLYNWLFYASNSPIWKSRIEEFKGQINLEQKRVHFPDDDTLEEFFEKYGFEPDEMNLETHHKHGVLLSMH